MSVDTGNYTRATRAPRTALPVILAPADSPSEEQFTLGNVTAELELEPRRANLLGAFDDAVDGPDDEADGQEMSPSRRPTAPPREKGVRFHCFLSERGYAILVAPSKGTGRRGGVLKFGTRR